MCERVTGTAMIGCSFFLAFFALTVPPDTMAGEVFSPEISRTLMYRRDPRSSVDRPWCPINERGVRIASFENNQDMYHVIRHGYGIRSEYDIPRDPGISLRPLRPLTVPVKEKAQYPGYAVFRVFEADGQPAVGGRVLVSDQVSESWNDPGLTWTSFPLDAFGRAAVTTIYNHVMVIQGKGGERIEIGPHHQFHLHTPFGLPGLHPPMYGGREITVFLPPASQPTPVPARYVEGLIRVPHLHDANDPPLDMIRLDLRTLQEDAAGDVVISSSLRTWGTVQWWMFRVHVAGGGVYDMMPEMEDSILPRLSYVNPRIRGLIGEYPGNSGYTFFNQEWYGTSAPFLRQRRRIQIADWDRKWFFTGSIGTDGGNDQGIILSVAGHLTRTPSSTIPMENPFGPMPTPERLRLAMVHPESGVPLWSRKEVGGRAQWRPNPAAGAAPPAVWGLPGDVAAMEHRAKGFMWILEGPPVPTTSMRLHPDAAERPTAKYEFQNDTGEHLDLVAIAATRRRLMKDEATGQPLWFHRVDAATGKDQWRANPAVAARALPAWGLAPDALFLPGEIIRLGSPWYCDGDDTDPAAPWAVDARLERKSGECWMDLDDQARWMIP